MFLAVGVRYLSNTPKSSNTYIRGPGPLRVSFTIDTNIIGTGVHSYQSIINYVTLKKSPRNTNNEVRVKVVVLGPNHLHPNFYDLRT